MTTDLGYKHRQSIAIVFTLLGFLLSPWFFLALWILYSFKSGQESINFDEETEADIQHFDEVDTDFSTEEINADSTYIYSPDITLQIELMRWLTSAYESLTSKEKLALPTKLSTAVDTLDIPGTDQLLTWSPILFIIFRSKERHIQPQPVLQSLLLPEEDTSDLLWHPPLETKATQQSA